ncbi:MAG: TetR/AcrR family transcriptional regulator [Pseudomonadota bacterium]
MTRGRSVQVTVPALDPLRRHESEGWDATMRRADDTTRRRGRPPKLDRRHALVQAKLLFWQHGYEHVGVSALCSAFGVNPPSLYAAFGSKLNLFVEVLGEYRMVEGLGVFEAVERADTAPEAVRGLIDASVQLFAGSDTRRGCMIFEAASSPTAEVRSAALPLLETHRTWVAGVLAARGDPEPECRAALLMTVLAGLSSVARSGLEQPEIARRAQALSTLVASAAGGGTCDGARVPAAGR